MDVVILRWWGNTDLLCSYHAWGRCMVVLRLCAVYPSFCASGIKLCTPGCPAVLAWLHLQVWSKRTQIHLLVLLHKDETTTHLPHDMQQSMCYSCVKSRKPAVTGHSNGQHQDQCSKWSRHETTFLCQRTDLVPCITCSYTCTKGIQLWTLTFQEM